MEDLKIDLGDLGDFLVKDDKELGFSVFRVGSEAIEGEGHIRYIPNPKKKLFFLNHKGEEQLLDWLEEKCGRKGKRGD